MTNQNIYFEGERYIFTLSDGSTVEGFVLGASAGDSVRLSPTSDARNIAERFAIAKADIVSAERVPNPFAGMRTIGYRKPPYRSYRIGK